MRFRILPDTEETKFYKIERYYSYFRGPNQQLDNKNDTNTETFVLIL